MTRKKYLAVVVHCAENALDLLELTLLLWYDVYVCVCVCVCVWVCVCVCVYVCVCVCA
jgi:hypothetical protein